MKSRIFFLIIVMLMVPFLCFAQSKKAIKKRQIKSQTVYEYFVAEGIKEPVVESVEMYDTLGNVVEYKNFNKNGELKDWQKLKYDSDGNKIEELTMDDKGKTEDRIVWLYKDGLIVEKKYFDSKDRLYKRKTYNYEYLEN